MPGSACLFVEGVPPGVDLLHVMLQALDITVLPRTLDQPLSEPVDLLQLQLKGVNLLLLELLRREGEGRRQMNPMINLCKNCTRLWTRAKVHFLWLLISS